MNLFPQADNTLVNTTKEYDFEETLLYEKRYKYLINLYLDQGYSDVYYYLRHFYRDLLFSIRDHSLTQDRVFFTSGEINYVEYVYTKMLIYRVQENISILDDLDLSRTKQYIYEEMYCKREEILENNMFDNCMTLPECIEDYVEAHYLRKLKLDFPKEYEAYLLKLRDLYEKDSDHVDSDVAF